MSERIETLRQVKTACFQCTKCKLCKGDQRVTRPHVFGRGNVNAKIIVVGQNPGYNETVQGKPFIGAAGKNFDRFLAEIGLTRQDIYITNTVKCYTPDNRGPESDEVQACKEILKKELEAIKPQVVVALGNYALDYFTGHGRMSKCHGQVEHSAEFDVDVFPMYHPSPLNMNKANIVKEAREDFAKLKQYLGGKHESTEHSTNCVHEGN